MTDYAQVSDGTRFRSQVDGTTYSSAPPAATDPERAGYVHWWVPPGSDDPFTSGALWALSWSLTTVFGDVLGTLLTDATLGNVERWNGTEWEQVA